MYTKLLLLNNDNGRYVIYSQPEHYNIRFAAVDLLTYSMEFGGNQPMLNWSKPYETISVEEAAHETQVLRSANYVFP